MRNFFSNASKSYLRSFVNSDPKITTIVFFTVWLLSPYNHRRQMSSLWTALFQRKEVSERERVCVCVCV